MQVEGAPSYFLSTQDGRAGLEDGKSVVRGASDQLAIVEVAGGRMRAVHRLDMPTSLVGPPSSIAVAPGGAIALITASTKRDPADPNKVVSSDVVSVVALDTTGVAPPRVTGSLKTGAGASGVSINAAGTLALVANRGEGSVSVLAIERSTVQVVGKVSLGEKSSPAHVAFAPDGRTALVSRDGDHRISVLAIDGQAVKLLPRELSAGLRPYGLDISADGAWAAVTNLGGGQGDADTISLIDLRASGPRVVDTVSVGQTPEGVFFSKDSKFVGVTVIDGSNKPAASSAHGVAHYRLFEVKDGKLQETADVRGGAWLQGHAFSSDGGWVLVQDAANRQIRLYRRSEGRVADTGERLQFDGAPSTLKFWR